MYRMLRLNLLFGVLVYGAFIIIVIEEAVLRRRWSVFGIIIALIAIGGMSACLYLWFHFPSEERWNNKSTLYQWTHFLVTPWGPVFYLGAAFLAGVVRATNEGMGKWGGESIPPGKRADDDDATLPIEPAKIPPDKPATSEPAKPIATLLAKLPTTERPRQW